VNDFYEIAVLEILLVVGSANIFLLLEVCAIGNFLKILYDDVCYVK
jgi:hypothetical protein